MSNRPVAYVVFNRPELTARTFAAIRKHRPSRLFIIADGPRRAHPTDARRCLEVRRIVEKVDWPCEVERHYADSNLGCKRRVSSGLDRVFAAVESAVVLEDDCLPHPDFFGYCDALLERYARDERVWAVTGDNFQGGQERGTGSYYFSKYNHCWGWASWARAWRHFDGAVSFWPSWRSSRAWAVLHPDPVERRYWEGIFDRVHAGAIDSWAYPWTASIWYRRGLTATPNVNLVSNIGFGRDATHTTSPRSPLAGLALRELGPLRHPERVEADAKADRFAFDHAFGGRSQRFPRSLPQSVRSLWQLSTRSRWQWRGGAS